MALSLSAFKAGVGGCDGGRLRATDESVSSLRGVALDLNTASQIFDTSLSTVINH